MQPIEIRKVGLRKKPLLYTRCDLLMLDCKVTITTKQLSSMNEWRARIARDSIFEQCVFCLPNMSKLVKHKLWDCIQARQDIIVCGKISNVHFHRGSHYYSYKEIQYVVLLNM